MTVTSGLDDVDAWTLSLLFTHAVFYFSASIIDGALASKLAKGALEYIAR